MQPKPEFLNPDDFPEPHMEAATMSEADEARHQLDLVGRLRDSIAWLERDGFSTSAGLAREAAAELRRLAAVERELEAHRLYARALCKAVDAATDFAGTVAGGASWWDDVWADHAAALDRARERISNAQGGEQ